MDSVIQTLPLTSPKFKKPGCHVETYRDRHRLPVRC